MMEPPKNNIVERTDAAIDRLLMLLQFLDSCFKYLQVQKLSKLRYELTYDYALPHEHARVAELCEDLKSSIKRQFENSGEIDGAVFISFYQHVSGFEDGLQYTATARVFNNYCRVKFSCHSSEAVNINISNELPGKEVIKLYTHFQKAIEDQLKLNEQ